MRMLRDIAKVPVGTAVRASALDDPQYIEFVRGHFDFVQPENELGMKLLRPSEDTPWRFGKYDALLGALQPQGLHVSLAYWRQLPAWVTREKAPQALEDHVDVVLTRLREVVHLSPSLTVANEVLDDDGRVHRNVLSESLGELYPKLVLDRVREARFSPPFWLNENQVERGGPKLRALIDYAKDVGVDGVGLQCHVRLDKDPDVDAALEQFRGAVRECRQAGLGVRVSELDVGAVGVTSANQDVFERLQARVFYGLIRAALEEGAEEVQFWGFCDLYSWRREEQATFLDADFLPKPAFAGMCKAFLGR